MTKQLYDEALADVKKLKEIAEDNAKKALIEAVTPRIKDLIEAELLKETSSYEEDKRGSETDNLLFGVREPDENESCGTAASHLASEGEGLDEVQLNLENLQIEPSEISGELAVGIKSNKNSTRALEAFKHRFESLSREAAKFIPGPSKDALRRSPGYDKRISEMVSAAENLYQFLQESVGNHDNKALYESKLEKIYKDLNQLTEQNMKNRLLEKKVTFSLDLGDLPDEAASALDAAIESSELEVVDDEPGDEEGLGAEGEGSEEETSGEEDPDMDDDAEVDVDLDDDSGSDDDSDEADSDEDEMEEGSYNESRRMSDNLIVEIDEGMLRKEIKRMRTLREAAEASDVQSWGHGAGGLGDLEDENLGDPFLDVDVTTEGSAGKDEKVPGEEVPGEEGDLDELYQAHDLAQYGGRSGRGLDQVGGQSRSPANETILRRLAAEKKIQAESRAKAQRALLEARRRRTDSAKQAAMGERAMKAANEKLARSAKGKAQDLKESARRLEEAYKFYATKFNESVRRTARLKNMLAESSKRSGSSLNGASARSAGETVNLRKKLAETNLFNMKLLYTNKLLQNESLTKRQKADVIERLDEAATEREVKLVYESVVKTLSGKTRSLSEGANRVIGSSSAPTRAASTVLNEGYEADRWAKLAGIK